MIVHPWEEFDLGKIFKMLYNIVQALSLYVSALWNYLTTPKVFGIEFLGFELGYTWTLLDLISAGGILVLVTFWIIKALVPVA